MGFFNSFERRASGVRWLGRRWLDRRRLGLPIWRREGLRRLVLVDASLPGPAGRT